MGQLLVYTKEQVSSKQKKITCHSLIKGLSEENSMFVLPHWFEKYEVIGDFDFKAKKKEIDAIFIKRAYNEGKPLQKGDKIIVDDGSKAVFDHYDMIALTIVSDKGQHYFNFNRFQNERDKEVIQEPVKRKKFLGIF